MSHNCQEFKIKNYSSRAIVIEQFSSKNFGDKNNISLSITIVGIRFMSKTVPAQLVHGNVKTWIQVEVGDAR